MGRRKANRAASRKSIPDDLRFPSPPPSAPSPSLPSSVFFAVKSNPFDPLDDPDDSVPLPAPPHAPASSQPPESSLVSSMTSELKALEDKLARKRAKIHSLKSTRDSLKAKVDTGYEQIKQLKNSQNKAKSLEEHNRLLQERNTSLLKEKEALEIQVVEMDRETAALARMQRELEMMAGCGLEGVSLEECQTLLTGSTEALVKIEDALKTKTESMLSSKRCLLCVSSPRSVLLLPCGHFSLCEPCANSAKTCPFCSGPVVARVKVHSS